MPHSRNGWNLPGARLSDSDALKGCEGAYDYCVWKKGRVKACEEYRAECESDVPTSTSASIQTETNQPT